ncbi:unnamed protein product [Boreogadus saida]
MLLASYEYLRVPLEYSLAPSVFKTFVTKDAFGKRDEAAWQSTAACSLTEFSDMTQPSGPSPGEPRFCRAHSPPRQRRNTAQPHSGLCLKMNQNGGGTFE